MSRTRHYADEVQAGRLTEATVKKVEKLNKLLFNNTKNNSEMTRFLINYAIVKLEEAKVELKVKTQTTVVIDGVESFRYE